MSNPIQQAIEALEMARRFVYADNRPQCEEAIAALSALQSLQGVELPEPHAWRYRFHTDESLAGGVNVRRWILTEHESPESQDDFQSEPLYTADQLRAAVAAAMARGAVPVPRGLLAETANAIGLEPSAEHTRLRAKLLELLSAAPSPEATQPTQAEAPSERKIEPLTMGEIRALMSKHGIYFKNISVVSALIRDVELEHGRGGAALATQQAGQGEALSEDEITLLLADKIGFGDSDLQWCNRSDLVSVIRAVEARYSTTPPAPQQAEALAQQDDAFEAAIRQTWQMIDPLRPPVAGSYFLGEHNGIAAALKTLRENYYRIRAARSSEGGQP